MKGEEKHTHRRGDGTAGTQLTGRRTKRPKKEIRGFVWWSGEMNFAPKELEET
jgi:hypothetical protein